MSVGPEDSHVFRGHVEVDYVISRGTASNHTDVGAPSQPGAQCDNWAEALHAFRDVE